MSMHELDRLGLIQAVAERRQLKPGPAAERQGLSTRQIRRPVARYPDDGPTGLVSRRRAKPTNNRQDAATANRALTIIRERYADFGPSSACEELPSQPCLPLSRYCQNDADIIHVKLEGTAPHS
ncbi:integrase catalytic subunit (plasmid) [Caballeronia insecticola]|uniref:Integrase catalytic subunit n=2 Tax=Caballeronia insecticola TaxID=758793 RepID=A0A060PJJ8_9BURK|nr:integrase catalytic subunit [Caballeronia insecticola]